MPAAWLLLLAAHGVLPACLTRLCVLSTSILASLNRLARGHPSAGTHPTVLEVLEVPQLMDTCCRSGNFDEALDLRAFVNKVGSRVLLVLGGL